MGKQKVKPNYRRRVLHLPDQSAQKNLASKKTAAARTRGSVRRASGFVQIAIALISPTLGE